MIEKELRRSLQRLRRSVEKAERELRTLEGTIKHAEAGDFPADDYSEARARMTEVVEFVDQETQRLKMKILEAGGLEPGRIRRSSGT